jgi:hypothetical protein
MKLNSIGQFRKHTTFDSVSSLDPSMRRQWINEYDDDDNDDDDQDDEWEEEETHDDDDDLFGDDDDDDDEDDDNDDEFVSKLKERLPIQINKRRAKKGKKPIKADIASMSNDEFLDFLRKKLTTRAAKHPDKESPDFNSMSDDDLVDFVKQHLAERKNRKANRKNK